MARRPSKKRRHTFPRANGMVHSFVDALVDAEKRSVTVAPGIQKAIVRGVTNATRNSNG